MKSSKMDRQGVRTPADVERKYPLNQITPNQISFDKVYMLVQQLQQTLSSFMAETDARLRELGSIPYDYTITFLVDGEVYEKVGANEGETIDAPAEPTSESGVFGGWQDAEGSIITFPYTPTGDIELTAVFNSYAEELWTHFGMSEETYPWVAVGVLDNGSTRVYFSADKLNNKTTVKYKHITVTTTSGLEGVTDAKTVVEWVKSKFAAPFTFNDANFTTVAGTYFANYEIDETDTVKYYPL